MRNVSNPTSAPDASKRPPPLAPDVNAVFDSITLAPSRACNACTRPSRSALPVPPVNPIAATGCPARSASRPPSSAGPPFQLGTRRKQRSWGPSAYCPVTAQSLPPPEIRIAPASRMTWQLVTTTDGATVTPLPTDKPPRSPLASTRTTLADTETNIAGCSTCAAATTLGSNDITKTTATCLRPDRYGASDARPDDRFHPRHSRSASFTQRPLFNELTAFVHQRNVVFAQDRRDRSLVFADELLHGCFPFGLSVPDSHCNLIVEFDAGFRL